MCERPSLLPCEGGRVQSQIIQCDCTQLVVGSPRRSTPSASVVISKGGLGRMSSISADFGSLRQDQLISDKQKILLLTCSSKPPEINTTGSVPGQSVQQVNPLDVVPNVTGIILRLARFWNSPHLTPNYYDQPPFLASSSCST